MVFRRSLVRELSITAVGLFLILLGILFTNLMLRLLARAAGGTIAPEGILALLGFNALFYFNILFLRNGSFVAGNLQLNPKQAEGINRIIENIRLEQIGVEEELSSNRTNLASDAPLHLRERERRSVLPRQHLAIDHRTLGE